VILTWIKNADLPDQNPVVVEDLGAVMLKETFNILPVYWITV
jgi:hypothetical protein